MNEQSDTHAVPCQTRRGLGPEFIYPFIVLFFATILRKLMRHYHISVPYTVLLMLIGAVLGAFYQYELIKRFTFIADLAPVEILAIFLPILIFESAFSCDPHIFIKCLGQILILAIIGFLISVILTTLAVMYWYENEDTGDAQTCWTWDQAVLYSAVVSATDPVSVVSLLKSMTSLKTLSTVIEGESLLNDAAAITIYTLVKNLIYESINSNVVDVQQTRSTLLGINAEQCANAARFLIKQKITAIFLLKFVLKTIAVAILIGYVIAHLAIFILYHIESGELETCITIIMSYFVYFACEAVQASGVIGVVLLGLTLNMNRSCFSVSAIHISEQTWQFLSYVANSLIFLTVGVILLKTHSGNNQMLIFVSSIPHLLLIYIILTLVRGIMILIVHFFLKQLAYGFTWKDSIVTIWAGLRGGVSLVLALTLFNSQIKDKYQAEIMLIHTIAIVLLTCTINALTISNLIHILHLDRTSELIKQTIIQVIKELKFEQNEMIRSLKTNPILATADWIFVEKAIEIQSPFEEHQFSRHYIDRIKCEHCQTDVTIPISKFEFEQTFEDCRVRILRLQKTHFWSDYYSGQLSPYGLHILNTLCDRAIDTSEKLIDLKAIKVYVTGKGRLRSLANWIRIYTRQWQAYLPWYCSNMKESYKQSDIVKEKWYSILIHYLPLTFGIMLIECTILIFQLHTNLCNRILDHHLKILHFIIEILSILLFIFDCIQSIHWFYHNQQRKYRFINLILISLYSFAILCRFLSCIIYFIIFLSQSSNEFCMIFYILKSLSLIQCLILSLFLIEPFRLIADYMLHRYVSLSYDIGLAYISSEEQVLRIINRLTENENIRIRIRELSLQQIKSILKHVLKIQEEHPGTIISIKTHHTLNLLYNTAKHGIDQIRSRGVLDSDDCNLLEQSLKNMYKQIHIPSTMPSTSPLIAIQHLSWIFASERLTIEQKNTIERQLLHALPNENSKRFENEYFLSPQNFTWQDFLWKSADRIQGVYLIVNGIVEDWKIDPYDLDAYQSELRWKENNRTKRATITTQQLLSPQKNQRKYQTWKNRNAASNDESIDSTETTSTNEATTTINTDLTSSNPVSYNDQIPSSNHRVIAFEDGFYVRWHHLINDPINEQFKDSSTIVDDPIQQTYHHAQSEENFDRFFNETFDQYRQSHPATSERAYRCYSYTSGDCIGLYDVLITENEKHQSIAKCLTNVTAFFISKEKLVEILDAYSLWNHVWLEIAIQLALRMLPNISTFQQSSAKTDFDSIDQRLSNAGLLMYNPTTCTSGDIIQLYEDLLLIAGSVRNQVTLCIYEAPIFIKRSLSKHGLKLLDGRSNTKILVIPRTTTALNKDDLFTDSSLIHYLLTHTNKRDFHQKRHSFEPFKSHPKTNRESNKPKYRTSLIETVSERYPINDELQQSQKMANIHRFLLPTSNQF